MTKHTIVAKNDVDLFESVGTHYLVDGDAIYQVNDIARQIWICCDGHHDTEEVATIISSMTGSDIEACLQSVRTFFVLLQSYGLVKLCVEGAHTPRGATRKTEMSPSTVGRAVAGLHPTIRKLPRTTASVVLCKLMLLQLTLQVDKAFAASGDGSRVSHWATVATRMRLLNRMVFDCFISCTSDLYEPSQLVHKSWHPGADLEGLLKAASSGVVPSAVAQEFMNLECFAVNGPSTCTELVERSARFMNDLLGEQLESVPYMSDVQDAARFNMVWREMERRYCLRR